MTMTMNLTTADAANLIIENVEADLASLNAVGCCDYHNDQTILDWSNRIAAHIECVAMVIGKGHPTVENLEIDLGRAITKAGANLYKRDHNITAVTNPPVSKETHMESFNDLLNRLEKNRESMTTHATCPIHDLAYDPEHWSCCERCWENLAAAAFRSKANALNNPRRK
jgi:hypothetical protein